MAILTSFVCKLLLVKSRAATRICAGVRGMGFRFRRSIGLVPGVRLNLSGGGASVSLGVRGLRYTVGSKGTRVTAGIPGTGLSWTQYRPHSQPRAADPLPNYSFHPEPSAPATDIIDPSLNTIESAPADSINAYSASELAPILNSVSRRIRLAPFVQLISVLIFVVALLQANQLAIGLSALFATIMVPIGIFLDRYRRSVKISYEPQGATSQISEALRESFEDLINSHTVWRIRAEGGTSDWKRNAGATTLSQRKKTKATLEKPDCIRGRSQFPALRLGSDEIYFLPDAALIIVKGSVAAVHYRDLEVSKSTVKFIEEERVPPDSPTVGQTWRYVNKSGGPDRRFKFNTQLPICLYGEVSFQSTGGLNAKIQSSNPFALDRLCAVVEVLHRSSAELPKAINYVKPPKTWPTAVFLLSAIALGAGQVAFFSKELPGLLRPADQKPATIVQKQAIAEKPPAVGQVAHPGSPPLENKTASASPEPLNILPPAITRSPPAVNQIEAIAPLSGPVQLPRPRPKGAPGPSKKNAAE